MIHRNAEDAVTGALEILRIENAVRTNWPEIKLRIVARSDAMLSAYRAIVERPVPLSAHNLLGTLWRGLGKFTGSNAIRDILSLGRLGPAAMQRETYSR